MDIFIEEHRQMLFALKANDVRFMLIGGYAVIYHGYARTTNDMDIWIDTGRDNQLKLANAFRDFGIEEEGIAEFKKLDFTAPQQLFSTGTAPRTIEFLTIVSNVNFDEAYEQAEHLKIGEVYIPVIHYNQLILSKITSDRLKDKADVEELQRINKYRKNKP